MADDRTDADSGERGGWFGRHQQVAWIGVFGAVAAALIAAVVPALLDSSDDDEPAAGAEAVAAPSSSSAAPPDVTPPPSADPTTSDPSSPPAGNERWEGRLLLDTEPKDLDDVPPVAVGYSDEGDVYLVSRTVIEGGNDTIISAWPGDPANLPGYEECAGTVDAEGTDKQELADDSVLCVRTGAGNVARLVVTERESGSDYRTTFDAVVWEGS